MLRLPSNMIKVAFVQVQSHACNYSHYNMFIDSMWWICAGGYSWTCIVVLGHFSLDGQLKKELCKKAP